AADHQRAAVNLIHKKLAVFRGTRRRGRVEHRVVDTQRRIDLRVAPNLAFDAEACAVLVRNPDGPGYRAGVAGKRAPPPAAARRLVRGYDTAPDDVFHLRPLGLARTAVMAREIAGEVRRIPGEFGVECAEVQAADIRNGNAGAVGERAVGHPASGAACLTEGLAGGEPHGAREIDARLPRVGFEARIEQAHASCATAV